MSGINGDKSRFNRVRKQKIARRMRKRALLKHLGGQNKPASVPSGSPAKARIA